MRHLPLLLQRTEQSRFVTPAMGTSCQPCRIFCLSRGPTLQQIELRRRHPRACALSFSPILFFFKGRCLCILGAGGCALAWRLFFLLSLQTPPTYITLYSPRGRCRISNALPFLCASSISSDASIDGAAKMRQVENASTYHEQ
jgi:hypothetical protein